MKFTIYGNPITKKNHGNIVMVKGHPIMLPSKPYQEYEKKCKDFIPTIDTINYPINIKCEFYMQTRRKVDISNLISAISDILTKYKVIDDDNRNIVVSYDGSRVFYDKENPRTIVEITKVDNYEQW